MSVGGRQTTPEHHPCAEVTVFIPVGRFALQKEMMGSGKHTDPFNLTNTHLIIRHVIKTLGLKASIQRTEAEIHPTDDGSRYEELMKLL